MAIVHAFVSAKSQSPDNTIASKNEWNAAHTIEDGTVTKAQLAFDPDATYAAAAHDHDADYSAIGHNHSGVYHPVPTGTPDGTKYLRDDNTWQAISGSGLTQPQVMARAMGC